MQSHRVIVNVIALQTLELGKCEHFQGARGQQLPSPHLRVPSSKRLTCQGNSSLISGTLTLRRTVVPGEGCGFSHPGQQCLPWKDEY